MCLVEVEKAPKLMPACVTAVAEGQVVHVNSTTAKKAREGVLEFLLINHPLDCPICDQAGECELQDYVFQEGRAGTRYAEYAKRYNPVEDFGPDILYVPEPVHPLHPLRPLHGGRRRRRRCSTCRERGDRAYIGISETQQLDHAWSGNVVDLCPVGSLLSKDFLHKARAWDLDKTASVCPGCTQGCNINIDTRDDVVVRHPAPAQPRGQPPLHLRLRPVQLPLDESRRPDRGAAGQGRRPARGHRLGHRRSPGSSRCCAAPAARP